ncbi:peroxiredoxin [Microbaculum marinum]|uniref:Glutathione-dependent peroxiredoxin n=1 Tax=Microbaculum marinum TaxID=1764581 RepID=A0AAW9RW54_9HYPH
MIKVGDKLPDATFMVMGESGPAQKSTGDVFSGRKVVLFAVPGAFTPTCNNLHLPGFLANADKFKAKGVDAIACVSTNDVFVLDAWSKSTGAEGTIEFLADGNADFARATGLSFDGSPRGMGTRSRRYAMLVDDGVVKVLNVEETGATAEASSADALLAQI